MTPPAANDPPPTDRSDRPERLRRRHGARIGELLEREPIWAQDFTDLNYEGRRLFSEFFGTFLGLARYLRRFDCLYSVELCYVAA